MSEAVRVSLAAKKQLTYIVDARPIHLQNSDYYTAVFSPKITTTAPKACQGLTGNDGSSSSNSTHFLYVATLWALVMPISQRRQRIHPQTLDAPSPDQWTARQVSQSHKSNTHIPISTFKIKPLMRDISTTCFISTSSLEYVVYGHEWI